MASRFLYSVPGQSTTIFLYVCLSEIGEIMAESWEMWGVHIIDKVHSSFFRVLCFVHCLSHSHLYPVLVSGVKSPDMKLGRKYLAPFQKLIRVSGQPVISLYFCRLRI